MGSSYNIDIKALLDVGQVKSAISQIQSSLNGLHLPQNVTKGLQSSFDALSKEVTNFEASLNKGISSKTDFTKISNQADKIATAFEKLKIQVQGLTGLSDKDLEKLFPTEVTTNINKATSAIKQYENAIKGATADVNKAQSAVNNLQQKISTLQGKNIVSNEEWKQLEKDIKAVKAEIDDYQSKIEAAKKTQEEVEARTASYKKSSTWREARDEVVQYTEAIKKAGEKLTELTNKKTNSITLSKQIEEIGKLTPQLTEAQAKLASLKQVLDTLESGTDGGGLQKLVQQVSELTGIDLSTFTGNAEQLGEVIRSYIVSQLEGLKSGFVGLTGAVSGAEGPISGIGAKMKEVGVSVDFLDAKLRDVSAFKTRIQYFFGLNNAVNLIKNAIRSAFNTIKDLDKAMTETAVVTDFSVSDMWKQLPEYTRRANELGVTTQAAYESATLFYQQGLNTKQAAELSTETLKMARIAGLEAAEATDRMTNALRGFNMELNATNAQRVDDVYSQLAANTASNVDEISTAMTKVASLAHSAGMEFETTSAFLAQIIETTRESAETAGTALKTVIARFSEVKKLYSEDQLSGTDEEGQIINVNKIAAALRTAGIDLNKYFLGEVGLDDIFVELASKWDTLTSVQQRYIATQAAGSRQQSRFIALMQDYSRTQELVSLAYTSTGASAKQFEKTQESLQSKLARLSNAWNEFLMGLTNNVVVKGAVDFLTDLLNIVNKITGAFGDGLGSVLKWTLAISTFSGIKGLFNTGGFLDKFLMTGLAGTNLGKKAVSKGLLSGLMFNGQMDTSSLTPEQIANLEANQGVRTSFIGSIGKSIWGSLQTLGKNQIGKTGIFGKAANKLNSGILAAGGSEALAAGLTGVATALGAVAAAIAVVYGLYQAWLNFTPEGQIKNAEKYAEALDKAAKSAQDNANSYRKAKNQIEELNEAVDSATTTEERSSAIQSRNEYIQSLLKENAAYAEYLNTTFEGGEIVLTLDSEALANAANLAAEAAVKAAAMSYFAGANVASRKAGQIENKLSGVDFETGTRTTYEKNEDGEDIKVVHKLDQNELSYYTNLELEKESYNKQAQNQAQTAYANLIDVDDTANKLGDDIANSMSRALAVGFEEIELPTRSGWIRPRGYWQNKYKEYYGYEADTSLQTADIARAVFEWEGTSGQRSQITQLADLLTGENKDTVQNLLDAFNGETEVPNGWLGIKDHTDLFRLMGFEDTEESAQKLTSIITELAGVLTKGDTKKFLDIIESNAKENQQVEAQNIFNTAKSLRGISKESVSSYLELDFDTRQIFESLYSSLSKNTGYLSEAVSSSLIEGIKNTEDSTEFTEWFSKLDLSNPISAYKELTTQANSANKSIKTSAEALLEAGEASGELSASNQLQYFLMSDSFTTLSSTLDDYLNTNKKITADNVNELAKSNKDLNNLLKNGIINANGLAKALENVHLDKTSIASFTNGVIAALKASNSLEGTITNIIDELNSFEVSYDEDDITNFISDALETATEKLDKGAYGNNAMSEYMTKLFGSFDYKESMGSYSEAYKSWLNTNKEILSKNSENMFSAWDDFVGEQNKRIIESNGKTASIIEQNGEIIIDAGEMTTDELIAAMTSTGEMTETWAQMMIADFKNYSADFAYILNKNDLNNSIKAWAEQILKSGWYYDSELETLATLLGTTVPKIKEILTSLGYDFTEVKLDTSNADKILETIRKIQQIQQGAGKNVSQEQINAVQNAIDGNTFNWDALKQSFNDANLGNYFESTMNSQLKEGDSFETTFGGLLDEATPVTIEKGQTAGEAYAIAYQKALNQDLADTFKDQFENLNIKITVDESGNAELKAVVDNFKFIANGANGEVKVKTSEDEISNLAEIVAYMATISAGAKGSVTVESEWQAGHGDHEGHTGGIVKSYAKGSENFHLTPGITLTGEEGPEIVWNKNGRYAYVTGSDGPEFQNLQPGDRVFNADETKKIFKNSDISNSDKIKSFSGGTTPREPSTGYGAGSGSSSSSSSSSSSDNDDDTWKNEIDWLYNLVEDIAELERIQTKLQEKYEDYLTDDTKTGKDLYNLLIERLANLEAQKKLQESELDNRKLEMEQFMSDTNDFGDMLKYNWDDNTLEIDWDAINQIEDQDMYDHVSDLISQAEDIQGKIEDAEDNLTDIENQIQELEHVWRDTYVDFEDRVRNALIGSYQDVIDNYSQLNDTLNDTNNDILNAIQNEIDLQRQIRDNTKTEDELNKTQAQISYLQRDTTGANAQKILQLQKQLDEDRENYEDTLVDQALNKLQESTDEAAKQREKQIDIMQAQLDYWEESGALNEEVASLIQGAIGEDGQLLNDSNLISLLQSQENWSAMSAVEQEVWYEELNNDFKEVVAFLLKQQGETDDSFEQAVQDALATIVAHYNPTVGSYSQGAQHNTDSSSGSGGSGSGSGSSGSGDTETTTYKSIDYWYHNKIVKKGTKVISTTKEPHDSNGGYKGEVTTGGKTYVVYYCSACNGLHYILKSYGGGCFAPGTQILMKDHSTKSIETIWIGDEVMAYDEMEKEFVPKKVVKSYIHHNTPSMVKIYLSDNTTMFMTPGHPLYSTNGWKSLDIENSLYEHGTITTLLKIGDEIIGIDHNSFVNKIEWINISLNYDSYNIEVEDCHTFLANGFVVHNAKVSALNAGWINRFSTGGLTTKTGLAWLDGTASEPEYVLNARQTQAFLKLADVLPTVMNGGTLNNTQAGNIYLDIDMHVDEIGSDYDVDRIVNRVKDIIYNASSYRNVNTINFIR